MTYKIKRSKSKEEKRMSGKILLCIAGIIAGLILLEGLLTFVGWQFTKGQDTLNKASISRGNEYLIICMGDSTTAIGGKDSWPMQLDSIFEERLGKGKVSVINKGRVLADTDMILEELNEDIRLYSPDMVIVMAGLNDAREEEDNNLLHKVKSALSRFRTFRLVQQAFPKVFGTEWIEYDSTEKAYVEDETIYNFNSIYNMTEERGIALVVVQYPMRELAPLEALFRKGDSIIFIDNEKVFQDAVKERGYDNYFVDNFAGDFGHLTQEGAWLLAENIADSTESQIRARLAEGGIEYEQ